MDQKKQSTSMQSYYKKKTEDENQNFLAHGPSSPTTNYKAKRHCSIILLNELNTLKQRNESKI